jgi:hypothetical protein
MIAQRSDSPGIWDRRSGCSVLASAIVGALLVPSIGLGGDALVKAAIGAAIFGGSALVYRWFTAAIKEDPQDKNSA